MFSRIKSFLSTMEERRMAPAVRELLAQEELNGRRVANRMRYAFLVMMGGVVFAVSGTEGQNLLNFSLLLLYFVATAIDSVLIARKQTGILKSLTGYIALFTDYGVFLILLMYYTITSSPDNFSFAVKNPIFYYFFVPLALSTLQFRLRPVLVSVGILLTIYGSLVAQILYSDVPRTLNWTEYTLGPAVIVSDLLSSRVVVILALGLVFIYSIYRALRMVQRIASIEAQKTSLARYFSPEVVEEITTSPEVLRKGGRQPVTVLFSDIRDFTAMSEGMESEALADFLGEFRGRMSAAIFQNSGTLDKFIGDAIMATFGTPRPSPVAGRDAANAVQAAREMLLALEEFNRDRAEKNQPPVHIGIGLHAGDVFAGNVGTADRLEFTVIGDAVNTASRIESLCKKLNAALLISDAVYELAGRPADAEKMPRVMVKGKEEPLQVYRLRKLVERADAWRR